MLTTLILGVLTSTVAEIVSALNKKLANTLLKGDAALLVALLMALIGAAIKVFYVDGVALPSLHDFAAWQALYPSFAEVWTVSQIYFLYVTQKLNLDVQAPAAPAGGV